MDRKIRFGLIGCGRISYKHLEAMAELNEGSELVCVCDIIEYRAKAKAALYAGLVGKETGRVPDMPRVYTNLDKMLKHEKIDVLSICTPSGLHPIHGIKAAERHVNVLTEKPMAVGLKAADTLIKACGEANVRLFVVKQNRLNSTVRLLKKAVDGGRFGKIHMILANVLWSRPQSYYDEAKWRGTSELDGGAFSNQASHYIDLVQWLGGPVEYVTAVTDTLARKIECEDSGSAVIRFSSGAIGNINVTMLAYPENLEGSITVIGERGTAKLGGVALNTVEKWRFEDEDEDDRLIGSSSYKAPDIYGYGHKGYYENVLEVLGGKAEPNTDGYEGRKSLELITAICKSAQEGRIIRLPVDP